MSLVQSVQGQAAGMFSLAPDKRSDTQPRRTALLGANSERQTSPGLTANLPSNNPFRNRAASPANSLPSPIATSFSHIPSTAPDRPLSRNPFLDQTDKKNSSTVQVRSASPEKGSSAMAGRASPQKAMLTGHAAELFDNLSLGDGPSNSTNGIPSGQPPPYTNRPPRSENLPPRSRNAIAGHQPSRSQEDPNQRPRNGKPRGPEFDIFADPASPEKEGPRLRPRRNSDSSINSRTINSEEERRRRERHRREREARYRGDKGGRPGTSSSRPKKPNKQLDLIDSLDVTSIYGTGLFHHDGPFDACNPHRNRKGSQRAPMQAFAKDSLNNTLGGSGPINKDLNFAQFHGRGAEGFTDYSTSGAKPLSEPFSYEPYAGSSAPTKRYNGLNSTVDRTSSFNPTNRVDKIHGEESMGLGTTTHLEGAPAARTVIQRRESENDQIPGMGNAGGLGRKRSLAQKIRGISNANRGAPFAPSGRVTSPEGIYNKPSTPTSPGAVESAGGMPNIEEKEINPFFNDYGDEYEKKGQKIQNAERRNRNGSIGGGEDQLTARTRALSSPKRAATGGTLERRITNDGTINGQSESSGGGGFLSRVKSLKGGKRSRPERKIEA